MTLDWVNLPPSSSEVDSASQSQILKTLFCRRGSPGRRVNARQELSMPATWHGSASTADGARFSQSPQSGRCSLSGTVPLPAAHLEQTRAPELSSISEWHTTLPARATGPPTGLWKSSGMHQLLLQSPTISDTTTATFSQVQHSTITVTVEVTPMHLHYGSFYERPFRPITRQTDRQSNGTNTYKSK